MKTIVLKLNGRRYGCKLTETKNNSLCLLPISDRVLFRGTAKIVVSNKSDNIEFFYPRKISKTDSGIS